jgi:sulfide:quinone oxidoreductase
MKRTLILGAGFGGITTATELRRLLGDGHEIVLIDRREHFLMGLRKLWALVGIGSLADGKRSRKKLSEHGIEFLQQQIRAIDPVERRVSTDGGTLDGDYLVVALGAEQRPDLVPGLVEHGHDVWNPEGVPALQKALADFESGRLAVVIAGVPYTCPPAPYECTMLLDDHLRERGLRDQTDLSVTTLQPLLLPNAGREGSAWLAEQLTARGIAFQTGRKTQQVEAGRVLFDDGELAFDLLIGVPPHRPPAVVKESGLCGEGEWIKVDPGTLATDAPGVFAIGDVTQIKLANGLPLPKAGVMAEAEGKRVAAAIAAEVRGEEKPAAFDGRGFCFIETGKDAAALVEGEFFAKPEPKVALKEISKVHAEEKRRFESERLARWFGSGGHNT